MRRSDPRRFADPSNGPEGVKLQRASFGKLGEMGGVVEEWLEAAEVHSPSVQMRIYPGGEIEVVSTHDQVLGGSTGQVYLGCHFPASRGYHELIVQDAQKIARVLREKASSVASVSTFSPLVNRAASGVITPSRSTSAWVALHRPFMALEFLTDGSFDLKDGVYTAPDGRGKYYFATDNLKSPAYRGLLPEDLFDLMVQHGIHFKHSTMIGVMFFMIGALSQYGKLGVTSIGNSREEADELYRRTVAILDSETGAAESPGMPLSLFERSAPSFD